MCLLAGLQTQMYWAGWIKILHLNPADGILQTQPDKKKTFLWVFLQIFI